MPKRFRVTLTRGAKADIRALRGYWIDQASRKVADDWTNRILDLVAKLEQFPDRGSRPPETLDIGFPNVRQLSLRPYRIIYQVEADAVNILMVIDGRRDVQTFLRQRLLSR